MGDWQTFWRSAMSQRAFKRRLRASWEDCFVSSAGSLCEVRCSRVWTPSPPADSSSQRSPCRVSAEWGHGGPTQPGPTDETGTRTHASEHMGRTFSWGQEEKKYTCSMEEFFSSLKTRHRSSFDRSLAIISCNLAYSSASILKEQKEFFFFSITHRKYLCGDSIDRILYYILIKGFYTIP